jgi:DNA-binding CsgD family transcriptional regulator
LPDEEPSDWLRRLSPVERALLDRLATGSTIATAAAAEFLSLRTANRRIADLRRRAGVSTTRELVLLYRAAR